MCTWANGTRAVTKKVKDPASYVLIFEIATFSFSSLQPTPQSEVDVSGHNMSQKVCLKVGTRRKGRKSKMQRLILRERESFNVLCHHHLPPLMKSLHVPPPEFPILHSALEQTLIQPPNLIPNAKT